MKIYIMYEVAGAMGHVSPRSERSQETYQAVTDEVNAAISAAAESGATEFLVNTGSPPCTQIPMDRIDTRAEVIRGMWKPDQTMEGLDESFDAMFITSMHAKARTPRAVFAHTWDLDIYDYRVNGKSIGELGMAAYFAAAVGVPTVLVSGDSATCREGRDLLGDVETAVTKESISWVAAKCPPPSKVLSRIRDAAARATTRLKDFKPVELTSPVTVEVEFAKPHLTDWWSWVPSVEVTGACSVKIQGPDYRAVHRLFVLLDKIQSAYLAESALD